MFARMKRLFLLVLSLVVVSVALSCWAGWRYSQGESWQRRLDRFAVVEAATLLKSATGTSFAALPPQVMDTLRTRRAEVDALLQSRASFMQEYYSLRKELQYLPYALPLPGLAMALAVAGGAVALLGVLGIEFLRRASLRSRQALYRCFRMGSRLLPLLALGVSLPLIASALVMCAYEFMLVMNVPGENNGRLVQLLVLVALGLLLCGGVLIFRMTKALFGIFSARQPAIDGLPVERGDAPRIWELVEGVAAECALPMPEIILLGFREGFCVTKGARSQLAAFAGEGGQAQAEKQAVIIHLDVPAMLVLEKDELRAVVGHELGHVQGEDLEYREKFSACYHSAINAMQTLQENISEFFIDRIAFLPAGKLCEFFLEAFQQADMHWSRIREFAADDRGAQVSGNRFLALALARLYLYCDHLREVVERHFQAGEKTEILQTLRAELENFRPQALSVFLEQEQPHPLDSHPSLLLRLEHLQIKDLDGLEAEATAIRPGALLRELGV